MILVFNYFLYVVHSQVPPKTESRKTESKPRTPNSPRVFLWLVTASHKPHRSTRGHLAARPSTPRPRHPFLDARHSARPARSSQSLARPAMCKRPTRLLAGRLPRPRSCRCCAWSLNGAAISLDLLVLLVRNPISTSGGAVARRRHRNCCNPSVSPPLVLHPTPPPLPPLSPILSLGPVYLSPSSMGDAVISKLRAGRERWSGGTMNSRGHYDHGNV